MIDTNVEKRLIVAPIEPDITEEDIRKFAEELNQYDYYYRLQ